MEQISNFINQFLSSTDGASIVPIVASGGLTVWLISNIKLFFSYLRALFLTIISFRLENRFEDRRGKAYYIGNLTEQAEAFERLISESTVIWEKTKNLDLNDTDMSNFFTENRGLREKEVLELLNKRLAKTYGFSIRIILGRLVFCSRSLSVEKDKLMVNIGLRVFFSKQSSFIRDLNKYLSKTISTKLTKRQDKIPVGISVGKEYIYSLKNKRFLSSIFTNGDTHMELFKDIQKFIDNKKIYQSLNYPYKYSALIYGKPGTGKTSAILGIASELNRSIEYIDLKTTSAISLFRKLNEHPENTIYVFEDIDAIDCSATTSRTESLRKMVAANDDESDDEADVVEEATPVSTPPPNPTSLKKTSGFLELSLSNLLNITDGLLSADGAICIFTTNHIEKLDPAFLRTGRMNKKVEFDYMLPETANRMIETYLGKEHRVEGLKTGIKPAELQEEILNIMTGQADYSVLDKFKEQE